eukprot:GHVT01000707.1.p1 GENE.GHVT01000707.1~~GHVT01000707.1.p1  ORF type:complete len:209 (+),score=13.79 GHVT01000707.1:811-1437(+)
MTKAGKNKKYAKVKRMINPNDKRVIQTKKGQEEHKDKVKAAARQKLLKDPPIRRLEQVRSSMFFEYNSNLAPPYQVLIDTNFINFSIQNKMDVLKGMLDCLVAKCIPCVTDCVIGELEKMGHRYRLALRLARDPRVRRLTCLHKGTYADDCIVQRVKEHRCFIVATNDKELKRRVRKIPGVPIMCVANHKYAIERLPDAITVLPVKSK